MSVHVEVLMRYETPQALELAKSLAKSIEEEIEKHLEAKSIKYNISVRKSNPYILEYGLDLLNVLGDGGVVVFLTILKPKPNMMEPLSKIYTLRNMDDTENIIKDLNRYLV
jgi:hypothetical protein